MSTPRLRLRVSPAAETAVRRGHPWIFADSIRQQNRAGTLGELAIVYDRADRFLAAGLFDPESPLRVRVLQAGKPVTIDAGWWEGRLREALRRRAGLFDASTTGYRLINGESDGWPALVLDRYADTLVMKLYSGVWLSRLAELSALIGAFVPAERLVLRLSRNLQSFAEAQFAVRDGQMLRGGAIEGPVVFLESGLRFEADVVRGQKTGFFLDQRENRRIVRSLASDREVLNAFSFSGGFSVYAAHGGARSVTDLDISQHALASARRNFSLNNGERDVARCRREEIQADAFEWLPGRDQRAFDLIVLDPPSLAKREAERAGALGAYADLALAALARLRAQGILVAASCSAHVAPEEFFTAIKRSAARSGRRFEVLQTTGHAPDHPATFAEAEYLKCIYLRVA